MQCVPDSLFIVLIEYPCSMSFNPGWYLIYTRAKHEKKVTLEMIKRNIPFYFPTTNVMRVWHDRQKMLEMPLFPSYIFVYLNTVADYFEAQKPEGVLSYVHFGREVARVRDSVIEGLKYILAIGGDIEVSTERFQLGQELNISHGPFSGLTCEVVKYKNQHKVLVRINLLNRVVLTDLPVSSLIV